ELATTRRHQNCCLSAGRLPSAYDTDDNQYDADDDIDGESVGRAGAVLLPPQRQRHIGTAKLAMHPGPIWHCPLIRRECRRPAIFSTTSSKCHLSPTRGSRRRIRLANCWPNLRAHCRTGSWLTMMPRAASNSSTIRSPSGNRKYSQTAWLMISAGSPEPADAAR